MGIVDIPGALPMPGSWTFDEEVFLGLAPRGFVEEVFLVLEREDMAEVEMTRRPMIGDLAVPG